MKKAISVLVWLGLGLCLILLVSNAGQKREYRDQANAWQRKNEALQGLYDQSKKDWQEEKEALEEENGALKTAAEGLREENEGLRREMETLTSDLEALRMEAQAKTDALKTAEQEWEEQRSSLTAEKDAASGRLSEVLALLLSPVPEAEETPEPAGEDSLFSLPEPGPDAPAGEGEEAHGSLPIRELDPFFVK